MPPLRPSTNKPNASWRNPPGGAGFLTLGTLLLLLMILLSTPAHAQGDTTMSTFDEEEGEVLQEEEGTAVLEATTISPEEATMPPASMTTAPAYENTNPIESTSTPAVEEQYASPTTLADTGGPGLLIVSAALICCTAILALGVIRGRPDGAADRPARQSEHRGGDDDDFMPRD